MAGEQTNQKKFFMCSVENIQPQLLLKDSLTLALLFPGHQGLPARLRTMTNSLLRGANHSDDLGQDTSPISWMNY